jgi:hypothetical protein
MLGGRWFTEEEPMRSLRASPKLHFRKSQGRELVAECEGFLAGELPCVYLRRGIWVPEWAWLSMLAHASPEQLARYAEVGPRQRPYGNLELVWSKAVALLAHELLVASDRTGVGVGVLQHAVLVDMELRRDRPERVTWAEGPSRFVDEVRYALDRFRRRQRGVRPGAS